MIARVSGSLPKTWDPLASEASLRQCGQFAAYGADRSFLHFYSDETGNRLTICDSHAILHSQGDTSEMRLFLTMDPTVLSVRTDRETAGILAEEWGTTASYEAVMRAPYPALASDIVQEIALKQMYPVLKQGFGDAIPPFDAWYADVHHRYRHQLCRAVGVIEDGVPVAVAMTVAECDSAALIGAVTTLPQARGKGYASACVLTLSARLQAMGKSVLLSPKNSYAHTLYERIGFTVCGEWGSVYKPI